MSQEKGPTFKLSVTCQILTDFKNFCTAGKRMKFATKLIRQYLPHLRHVATLPWEIENTNCRQQENANKLHFCRLALLLMHKF